eukprot:6456085-Amphidinium_carterae.1
MSAKDHKGKDVNATTDLIIHTSKLTPLAVLGGYEPENKKLIELLRDGYPADHLLQLAVLEVHPTRTNEMTDSSDE